MKRVPTAENRRRLRNFFVKPNYQTKYAGYQIGGGLGCFAMTAGLAHAKLAQVDALMAQARIMDVATQVQIGQLYTDIATLFMVGFAGYISYASILILVLSHRVYGPMVAIVAAIEELIKGNYGPVRPLRRNDELVPIHEHLQTLSNRLKEKDGGATDVS
ncbi:MAG: hypothetical protein O7E57_01195 [Gammaproteobacteria bacterium]|nr:hypothetical protein [Gammaproteobacteria bacterium]